MIIVSYRGRLLCSPFALSCKSWRSDDGNPQRFNRSSLGYQYNRLQVKLIPSQSWATAPIGTKSQSGYSWRQTPIGISKEYQECLYFSFNNHCSDCYDQTGTRFQLPWSPLWHIEKVAMLYSSSDSVRQVSFADSIELYAACSCLNKVKECQAYGMLNNPSSYWGSCLCSTVFNKQGDKAILRQPLCLEH